MSKKICKELGAVRDKYIHTKGNYKKPYTIQNKASYAIFNIKNKKEIFNKPVDRNDKYDRQINRTESFRETEDFESRFLFQNVFSEKVRRHSEANIRPTGFESTCQSKTFSADIADGCGGISTNEGLAHKNRFTSSIFPHTYISASPTIFKNCLQPRSSTTHIFTFWPVFSPPDICSGHKLGSRKTTCARNSYIGLPRRLSDSSSGQVNTNQPCLGDSRIIAKSRLACEFSEIGVGTSSGARIFGTTLEHQEKSKNSSNKQSVKNKISNFNNFEYGNLFPETVPKTARSFKFCQPNNKTGALALSSNTKVSQIISSRQTKTEKANTSNSCPGTILVEKSHRSQCSKSSPAPSNSFFNDRCSRYRMGSSTERASFIRKMETKSDAMAFQSKGDVCCIQSNQRTAAKPSECAHISSVRQQNSNSLFKERGRGPILSVAEIDDTSVGINRSTERHSDSGIPPGEVQRNSRPLIKKQTCTRMALITPGRGGYISKMGCPRHRSLCLKKVGRCATLRHMGLKRWLGRVLRRIQSKVAISTSVGVSSTQPNTTGTQSLELSRGHIHTDSTILDKVRLDARSQGQSLGGSPEYKEFVQKPDRSDDQQYSTAGKQAATPGLESWGWADQVAQWTCEEKELLKSSWRESTLNTYKAPIKRWIAWCKTYHIDQRAPEGKDVARFLAKLFLKDKLAYNTILLHKSAISTYCATSNKSISNNFFVHQVLKAISLNKPQSKKSPIWDTKSLFDWLEKSHGTNTLFDISRRTALILLLASGRRLHDLTLLDISVDNLTQEEESIILWPKFGSKTDSGHFRQSGWLLKSHPDPRLCPIKHINQLIQASQERRSEEPELTSLFISITGLIKGATKTMISGWIKSIFKEADVRAPPGSIRAAVASKSWLENRPLDEILSKGNWICYETFKKFYCRQVKKKTDTVKEDLLCDNFCDV